MKRLFTILSIVFCVCSLSAQTFVVIGKESRIFDRPNVKSYATTNMSGQDVVLQPGMAFKLAATPADGWVKIEYTPGLNAFMLESQTAPESSLGIPKPGKYPIANNPGSSIDVVFSGKWSANDGKETYDGLESGKAVIFTDKFGNTVYSLVVLGGKPVAYSYNNDLTKFL